MRTPSFKRSPLALCALLALGAVPAQAQVAANTLPVLRPGGAVVNATVGTPAGNTLAITQTQSASNRGLIEWSSFSIGSAARVTIAQPNAQSLLVNRVTGPSPSASEIHGALSANGRVMLINPAGVIFGSSAQVSAGSLVASALDLDSSMSANNYASLVGGDDIALSGGAGAITVQTANDPRQPQIQVTEGGSIVLLSQSQIEHHGVISAPRGEVNMSNGSAALLRSVGTSGFVRVLQVTPSEPSSSSLTTGLGSQTLAAGGRIVIGGQPREEGDARVDNLNIAGVLSTASDTGNGGSIHIDAGGGGSLNLNDASVDASSSSASGGQVTLLGRQITLQRGEQPTGPEVLADGATGGGRIEIGDARTRALLVNDTVLLSADATRNGNGGQIALRAMYNDASATSPTPRIHFGVTEVYGTLRARGGTEGGNGGQIETSGMAVTTALANSGGVYKRGTIDARARAAGGTAGAWTLDPYDVTISNAAPQDVAGSFEPIGPGANVQASDIVAALDAGTSVVISTDAGGAGSQAGNISIAPGTNITRTAGTGATTLTLRANNNVSIDGTIIGSSGAGPVNLNLFADLDGNGTGGVSITNSSLSTGGGSVTASGGLDPATGYARGDASNAAINIATTDIDTSNLQTGTAGDIVLRGRASTTPGAPAAVRLAGNFTFGNLTIDGRASHGTAVLLNGANLNATGAGNIDIRGIATRTDTLTASLAGIEADGTRIVIHNGTATLAGRGDDAAFGPAGAVGLRIGDLEIVGAGSTPGTVKLVGQSTGGSIAPGIQMVGSATTGLVVDDGDGGAANLNLVIGALSDVRASSLELGVAGVPPQVDVSGTVNIRPLGVSGTTGDLVEQPTVGITVIPRGANAGAGTMTVLSDMLAAGGGIAAAGGVVIGSRSHTGAIVLDTNAFGAAAPAARLTLQNEGAGSLGITVRGGNTFGSLGLLSAGNIGQVGSFTTGDLVIRGGAASTVTLDSAANQINGVLAFDPPASLTVRTAGDLTVDAATAAAYDAASATPFAPLAITTSLGGNTAVLQAGGNILINRPITMTGTATPRLDIVSPGTVTFATGAALSAPGGQWRVWAPTVVNPTVAGSFNNLYGCVYGDTTTCSISGIALPTTGNGLMRATQPTITVAANPTTGVIGAPLPPLGYTVTGLVNGDTAAGSLSGSLSATPSGTNTYAIGQGTLASPLGYNIVFTPSVLTLRQAELTRHMLMDAFHAENSSDVYGRNLDQPYVCTAASVMRGGLAEGADADKLASEWGKVRNQPQLSGCLNVSDGGSCSAF
ncbi:filamentous hemagglutinin N-terminal domain-containing protein [Piscinibacter gummiphilus]|uniref:Filamentous hemagglutinin N-terminal domain-containing protein n=1 Tax=Piscinibacter gummiphilus TaxID=946333 RepID=A0ABZ0CM57_9BURK|nr:filamentous hemagglutinin N-terminal domain-containing protein [Piscinibacter gummiphilus]WOB06063.1 filamentous hemagglutinin N-terminal domain-containing protein [Piscinibacter gummiphilus]